MKDNNGTEIKVGSTVVFNRSGELELGEVIDIKPRKDTSIYSRYGSPRELNNFHIKAHRFSNTSIVRYPCSIMVIK